MFEESEEELVNRMYEEEIENRAYQAAYEEHEWNKYCQEMFEREHVGWGDFEDRIKDRLS